MSQQKIEKTAYTCDQLGLCQAQFGGQRCAVCTYVGNGKPVELAPGVIDGPYRRVTTAGNAIRKTTNAMRGLRAYLMGTKP